MNRSITFILAAVFSITGLNARAVELKPWMLKKGAVVFQDDFSGALNPEEWISSKGIWTIENGTLKGVERASDQHAAAIRREAPMRNVIIQFDFRFDGSPGFALSMNHAAGHNSRVVFTPDGFTIQKDLNKNDPADFLAVLGECAYPFEPGKWYTMLVEYHGPEMLARIDDPAFILGTHSYIDQERTNLGFPTRGNSAAFDNVTVWEGTLQPGWTAKRNQLLKKQNSRPDMVYADPKTAWQAAESKLRAELMGNDPAFKALVQTRAGIDTKLKSTYAKAFRTTPKAAEEKSRLMANDPDFKQLNRDLTLARKKEREYMQGKAPRLAELYEQMNAARKTKN